MREIKLNGLGFTAISVNQEDMTDGYVILPNECITHAADEIRAAVDKPAEKAPLSSRDKLEVTKRICNAQTNILGVRLTLSETNVTEFEDEIDTLDLVLEKLNNINASVQKSGTEDTNS